MDAIQWIYTSVMTLISAFVGYVFKKQKDRSIEIKALRKELEAKMDKILNNAHEEVHELSLKLDSHKENEERHMSAAQWEQLVSRLDSIDSRVGDVYKHLLGGQVHE